MADNDLTAKPAEPVIPVQERAPDPLIVATEADDTAPAAGADDTLAAAGADDTAPAAGADDKKPEKLPAWADKTIKDSAFEAREARREAKRLADENAALRRAAATPVPADQAAAEAAAPKGGYATQADFDAAVQRETQKRVDDAIAADSAAKFNQDCNTVFDKGTTDFKDDFNTAVGNLNTVGVIGNEGVGREILGMLLEADEPQLVIFELGKDPDKAAALLTMTPAKRAMEIGRIAATAKKQQPRSSEAPPPVKIVEGSPRVSGDPRDDDDDATWFAKREKEVAAREGRA